MKIKDWELLSKDKNPEDSTLMSSPRAKTSDGARVIMCQDFIAVFDSSLLEPRGEFDIPIEVMIALMNFAGYEVKVREPK